MGLINRVLGYFSNDMAIDLGTAHTLVCVQGQGVVLNEPSVVAVDRLTNQILAVGSEAKRMVGRTPGNIVAIRPMKEGVIADFEMAERMLRHFITVAHNRRTLVRPRVIIGVPSRITQVEQRAVKESAELAGAREVYLVEEAMAAAIGAGLPIAEPSGSMVIDIGGGTTDIAIIAMGGIVYSASVRIAGDQIDAAIISYLKRVHGLLIGEPMAERVKVGIGSVSPLPERTQMMVKGRDLIAGIPRSVPVRDDEIREILRESMAPIVAAIRTALEHTPPELAGDIVERGIVLTGGGSLLRGLDVWLQEETGLPIISVDDPLMSVVLGVGKMLDEIALLQNIASMSTNHS